MKKLCLIGAFGRMGLEILKILESDQSFKLSSAVVRSKENFILLKDSHSFLNKFENKISIELVESIKSADVVIDFSSVDNSLQVASICAENKKPLLIGVTGFSQTNIKDLKNFKEGIPISVVSNTSLAVFVMTELVELASRYLANSYDIQISEIHHKRKKDAPSGTGLMLAKVAVSTQHDLLQDVKFPHIASLRGGGVIGDHTVLYLGEEDRIEISHKAISRGLFAKGALKLAEILCEMPAGFYTQRELYSHGTQASLPVGMT